MSSPKDPRYPRGGHGPEDAGETPVLAAGCVLWRRSAVGGGLEVCLVHRPKYDDWSHPKGKLKRGEDALAGALREVVEETGYTAVPGAELPTLRYRAQGRPKEVRYWAAEAGPGGFVPNLEVDRVLWLPPASARARLTQPRDRDLVDALMESLRSA
ncbi:NUDIX hydrolase [Streptomyces lasalocidi]|uniref:NUDIX hydrolase n=1 Tax=Streptomyces lasalocidi TaxID=324833 RepID=A0A4U5WHR9_STRLS|nr:NUDIX hydrolase [Streptomyces lasalocidi]